jgi:hypothetical protein
MANGTFTAWGLVAREGSRNQWRHRCLDGLTMEE